MSNTALCSNKSVLITGACGTIGSKLVERTLEQGARRVVAFDHNENGIFQLSQIFDGEGRVVPTIGNVADKNSIANAMSGVDLVFHGAALKHVYLGEQFPDEIVQTNIIGAQNVISAAIESQVERVTFMSSDKAVNPTNVMGTSKLMGERLITGASCLRDNSNTIFSSTRFGNVLGSRGSVVPVFMRQIREGKDITLTDEEMSRFVMTCDQAVDLVLGASAMAVGGEVFITKMPVLRIRDLIDAVVAIYAPECNRDPGDVKVKTIGARPGEKMYEELMSSEEVRRAIEIEDYFVVLPALETDTTVKRSYEKNSTPAASEYRSDQEQMMSVEEIIEYCNTHKLLDQVEL